MLGGGEPAQRAGEPARLQIVVAEGDGAINDIRSRRAKEPVVIVQDDDGRTVSGAAVHFILPGTGPGGSFADGESSLTVTTDSRGRAVGRGLRPNRVAGPFEIRVTASSRGQSVSAVVRQTNVEPAAAESKASRKIAILALIGGAIAGGVIAASRGGDAASSPNGAATIPPATVVMPGTPVAGPPQ